MLGWEQKVLWCTYIFLYSFIFWIENALHLFICDVFIQNCPFFEFFWCWFGFFIHFLMCYGSVELVPPHHFWCNLAVKRQIKIHCDGESPNEKKSRDHIRGPEPATGRRWTSKLATRQMRRNSPRISPICCSRTITPLQCRLTRLREPNACPCPSAHPIGCTTIPVPPTANSGPCCTSGADTFMWIRVGEYCVLAGRGGVCA
jgi:hypothetical protein